MKCGAHYAKEITYWTIIVMFNRKKKKKKKKAKQEGA